MSKPLKNTPDTMLSDRNYVPNTLLDELVRRMNLKNDAALARVLEITPPLVSKLRHLRLPIGASVILRIHDVTGMPIKEIRALMYTSDGPTPVADTRTLPLPLDAQAAA